MTDSLHHTPETEQGWLNQLHRRHGAWFRANLVRRYGAQEAEDLIQETWLSLSRLCAADDVRAPRAFLMKVATNYAFQRHNARARRERAAGVVRMDSWGVQDATQTETVLVKQVVLGLPQPLRDVFVLSRFSGMSNEQIGRQLGISPKTVEWRMTKALAHCAAQLQR